MADAKPARRSPKLSNPEAVAFGVITSALEELPTEVVHRVLDHAAKMYGFYVVTDLPVHVGSGERLYGDDRAMPGEPVERTFEPSIDQLNPSAS